MGIRRKGVVEEDEKHDRWLVSYADFVTLLFAFFVVMYAISSINEEKYRVLSQSIGQAFSDGHAEPVKVVHVSQLPEKTKALTESEQEDLKMDLMGKALAEVLAPFVTAGNVHIMKTNLGIRIDLNDTMMFATGSADLSSSAIVPLKKIADALQYESSMVNVEGHTDSKPMHSDKFYSNWELSAARASATVRFLESQGIASMRLTASGFNAYRPIAAEKDELSMAKNRRVSIMLLKPSKTFTNRDISEIRP